MSSRKVLGFLIATGTLLAVSLVITFTLILPNHFNTKVGEVLAYSFNVGGENDSKISEMATDKLSLTKSIVFSPTKSVEWSDGFVCYGNTIDDGVEYSNTQTSKYICAIPFTVSNCKESEIKFTVEIMLSGALQDSVSYKVYDYGDKKYKSLNEINIGYYEFDSSLISKLEAKTSKSFCLVCYAEGDGQALTEKSNINIQVSC